MRKRKDNSEEWEGTEKWRQGEEKGRERKREGEEKGPTSLERINIL